MLKDINFILITLADFIVRTAYQIGKTPLLPIFALSLGATDAYLGLIVSISTLTGMMLKPFVGILSDIWGRRNWLIVGTIFFTLMPFVYQFVHTSEQLFMVRIIHGMSTAIYGPVTLAYVAEQYPQKVAERVGWFSIARSTSYIIGPAVAGWLLLYFSPPSVFTIIGLLSSVAFFPIFQLSESNPSFAQSKSFSPLLKHIFSAWGMIISIPSVWLSGGLDATMYIALYAVKAFLPIYALSMGVSTVTVGVLFSLQEVTCMLLKPLGGHLADRCGYFRTISLGMILLSSGLLLLNYFHNHSMLLISFMLMGTAQSFITPATIALVSDQVEKNNLGASLGLIGTFKNAGKVAGPIIAGMLIHWLDFVTSFLLIGSTVMLWAISIGYAGQRIRNINCKK